VKNAFRPGLLATLLVVLAPAMAPAGQGDPVQWVDGRLTVRAQGLPLKVVVDAVAAETGIAFSGTDRLRGTLSVEFENREPLEGISLLLEGVNYLVSREAGALHIQVHSMSGAVAAPVARTGKIIIAGLSDVGPGESEPDPDDDDEIEELSTLVQALEAPGPDAMSEILTSTRSDYISVRIAAVRALAGQDRAAAIPLLASALADEDTDVSLTASDVLTTLPGDDAMRAIGSQLAPTAEIDAQFAALRALALRAEIASIPLVKNALANGHPQLRDFAAQLLRELEERQRASAAARTP
jgi:hypothetical protein